LEKNRENAQPIRIRFRTISLPNKLRFHVEGVFFRKYIIGRNRFFSGFNTDGSINLDDLTIKKICMGLLVIMYGIGKGGSFKTCNKMILLLGDNCKIIFKEEILYINIAKRANKK